ncbi:hypothetical protein K474DRAFT_1662644 [Panus rudis PR-1116 ss-1]|nr:hypothetical protein K474DRAFT_1662644 [Panus rudis PR-1116 ss-1]
MQSPELLRYITAGTILVGSKPSEPPTNLRDVLSSRLNQLDQHLDRPVADRQGQLEDVQLETAQEALNVVCKIQQLIVEDTPTVPSSKDSGPSQETNLLGTRDLTYIRTLLSIAFKWGIEPLLRRVMDAIPTTSPVGDHTRATLIDLTNVPEDYARLRKLLLELFKLVLPNGIQGTLAATHITITLIDRHLADLIRPSICLGWLPKPLSSDSVRPMDDLRPLVMHLTSLLPVSKTVSALISILPDKSLPSYGRRACSFLLSKQLFGKNGVQGLLIALFDEEEESGEEAPLEKLEQVAKLMNTIPKGVREVEYSQTIIPQLVAVLSSESQTMPRSHKRAAAFSLSRALISFDGQDHSSVAPNILLSILQQPFLMVTQPPSDESTHDAPRKLLPVDALRTLQSLLTNTDPSPTLISSLLTPIVPSLFSLWSRLEGLRTVDPSLRVSTQGILETWGRLVSTEECVATMWLIVSGEGGEWKVDIAGNIARVEESDQVQQRLSLFTPEDLRKAEEAGEFDVNANILQLRPDPVHFVRYLKLLNRSDVSGEIFVNLLEAYRQAKSVSDADPMRTLLYLQLVMQIQSQIATDDSSTNLFKKPAHILSFVKHALESAIAPQAPPPPKRPKKDGLGLEDLRIVDVDEEDAELDTLEQNGGDVEDDPEDPSASSENEMTSTALNLLLSILEANTDLSAETSPILNEIPDLLEKLTKDGPPDIKQLAREARMVLTARLASSSMSSKPNQKKQTSDEQAAQETYQKALKLLQDPILPVRAHGLLLLRQLVSSRSSPSGALIPPAIDRALVPGILSIFLQSLQDDDSYIFLNAVQGLSAMVDGFGKETLKGLVDMYVKGLDGLGGSVVITKQDVDARTRIGEALGQVVKRCAEALPGYGDILVPPLFSIIRDTHLPTTLRTSALSLLALCADVNPLALFSYTVDLITAMVDLLQVESVPLKPEATKKDKPPSEAEQTQEKNEKEQKSESNVPPPPSMDAQPTSTNSKFPPLRRAALHFLSLLTRSYINQTVENHRSSASSGIVYGLPPALLRRAKTTVGYVAATDEDNVARVMAREVLEGLHSVEIILLGL